MATPFRWDLSRSTRAQGQPSRFVCFVIRKYSDLHKSQACVTPWSCQWQDFKKCQKEIKWGFIKACISEPKLYLGLEDTDKSGIGLLYITQLVHGRSQFFKN